MDAEVFERVLHGNGNGLVILQGPSEIANKSFFLNLVGAFQKEVNPSVIGYLPSNLSRLFDAKTRDSPKDSAREAGTFKYTDNT